MSNLAADSADQVVVVAKNRLKRTY